MVKVAKVNFFVVEQGNKTAARTYHLHSSDDKYNRTLPELICMLHVISQLDGFSLLIILVNRLLQYHMTVLRSTTLVNVQTAFTLCSSEQHRILYKSIVI